MYTDLEKTLKELMTAYPKIMLIDITISYLEIEYKVTFGNGTVKEFKNITSMLTFLDNRG